MADPDGRLALWLRGLRKEIEEANRLLDIAEKEDDAFQLEVEKWYGAEDGDD